MSAADITRRHFIRKAGAAGLVLPLSSLITAPLFAGQRKVTIFSKCLHWLDYDGLASFVAACGFDGVDLTVRPGGHVEPERVAIDLPKAAAALAKKNIPIVLITTEIQRASDPYAESILKTASQIGIGGYRMGWYTYSPDKTLEENLTAFEVDFRNLAKLNQQYKIRGGYQNHAGENFGSAVWDVGRVLHDVDSPWIGSQYDVRHATAEGAHSWVKGFEFIRPYINSLDVKDFYWGKSGDTWKDVNVPLGQGMVDFVNYFRMVRALPDDVPMSLHAEYDLGGAEGGARKSTLAPAEIQKKLTGDLSFIRSGM